MKENHYLEKAMALNIPPQQIDNLAISLDDEVLIIEDRRDSLRKEDHSTNHTITLHTSEIDAFLCGIEKYWDNMPNYGISDEQRTLWMEYDAEYRLFGDRDKITVRELLDQYSDEIPASGRDWKGQIIIQGSSIEKLRTLLEPEILKSEEQNSTIVSDQNESTYDLIKDFVEQVSPNSLSTAKSLKAIADAVFSLWRLSTKKKHVTQ